MKKARKKPNAAQALTEVAAGMLTDDEVDTARAALEALGVDLPKVDVLKVHKELSVLIDPDVIEMLQALPTKEQVALGTNGTNNTLGPEGPAGPEGGRPTLLSREVAYLLTLATYGGAPVKIAAEFAGVADRTVYDWMQKGRDDEEQGLETPFCSLRAALTRARARQRLDALSAWRAGFRTDWRAAAHYLAATEPQEFAPTKRVEMTGSVQHGVVILPALQALPTRKALPGAEKVEALPRPAAPAAPKGDGTQ